MEAHNFVSRISLNPLKPLPKPPTKSPFLIFSQSKKWVSFKTQSYSKLTSETENKLDHRIIAEKLQSSVGDDSVSGIRRKKLAVFVSGGGSNFRSLHQASITGLIHGDIAVLVTNKPDCGGAEYARQKGISVVSFPKVSNELAGLSPADLVTALKSMKVDFILLAGYLKLIPVELVQAYPRSILNIHPSLLPAFGGKGYYGMKVHRAVIASGARYSGATIHFVDEHYDTGRILAQRVVPVLANDTAEELASRVLHEEHQLYVEVTSALCEERIVWREDGVPLIQSKENPKHFS